MWKNYSQIILWPKNVKNHKLQRLCHLISDEYQDKYPDNFDQEIPKGAGNYEYLHSDGKLNLMDDNEFTREIESELEKIKKKQHKINVIADNLKKEQESKNDDKIDAIVEMTERSLDNLNNTNETELNSKHVSNDENTYQPKINSTIITNNKTFLQNGSSIVEEELEEKNNGSKDGFIESTRYYVSNIWVNKYWKTVINQNIDNLIRY